MNNSKIISIKAKKILDSRGNSTIEVELKTEEGVFKSSVPSGASTGKNEAIALETEKAIENVNKIIAPKILGKDPTSQKEIDELMIALDGTKNKSKLGANAILAVSLAICRAGAASSGFPLYKYINRLFISSRKLNGGHSSVTLPVPCFNVINGGAHTKNGLDIQEFMVIPQGKTFSENFKTGKKIYQNLKKILKKKFGGNLKIGDEAGFVPPLSKPEEALDLIMEATEGFNINIGLDCAASQLQEKKYSADFYKNLTEKYPIVFIEDPFSEDDWQGFREITQKLSPKITIVGDDLLTTNINRMEIAKKENACNGAIIKPNQIGTVTETIEAVKKAKFFDWKIIVSHRSGETTDDFISDLAVGVGADFIKSGAPATKFRLVKYERLLEIEKEIS